MNRIMPTILVAFLLAPCTARAIDECTFGVKPDTSGFPLNPVLDKLVVTSAKPSVPRATCSMQTGDQILEVNHQTVPGQRALAVLRYFKAIKDGDLYTIKVKRDGGTVIIISK